MLFSLSILYILKGISLLIGYCQKLDTSPAKKKKQHPHFGKESKRKQTGEQSTRLKSPPKSTSGRLERKDNKNKSAKNEQKEDKAIDDEDDEERDEMTETNHLSSGQFQSLLHLDADAARRNVKKGKTPRKANKMKTASNSGSKGSAKKGVGSGGARPQEVSQQCSYILIKNYYLHNVCYVSNAICISQVCVCISVCVRARYCFD